MDMMDGEFKKPPTVQVRCKNGNGQSVLKLASELVFKYTSSERLSVFTDKDEVLKAGETTRYTVIKFEGKDVDACKRFGQYTLEDDSGAPTQHVNAPELTKYDGKGGENPIFFNYGSQVTYTDGSSNKVEATVNFAESDYEPYVPPTSSNSSPSGSGCLTKSVINSLRDGTKRVPITINSTGRNTSIPLQDIETHRMSDSNPRNIITLKLNPTDHFEHDGQIYKLIDDIREKMPIRCEKIDGGSFKTIQLQDVTKSKPIRPCNERCQELQEVVNIFSSLTGKDKDVIWNGRAVRLKDPRADGVFKVEDYNGISHTVDVYDVSLPTNPTHIQTGYTAFINIMEVTAKIQDQYEGAVASTAKNTLNTFKTASSSELKLGPKSNYVSGLVINISKDGETCDVKLNAVNVKGEPRGEEFQRFKTGKGHRLVVKGIQLDAIPTCFPGRYKQATYDKQNIQYKLKGGGLTQKRHPTTTATTTRTTAKHTPTTRHHPTRKPATKRHTTRKHPSASPAKHTRVALGQAGGRRTHRAV